MHPLIMSCVYSEDLSDLSETARERSYSCTNSFFSSGFSNNVVFNKEIVLSFFDGLLMNNNVRKESACFHPCKPGEEVEEQPPSYHHQPEVVIIGGGIVGLVLALALKKHVGIIASIYEQTDRFMDDVGAGMGLYPNGLRVIRDISPLLLRRIRQNGYKYNIRKWETRGGVEISGTDNTMISDEDYDNISSDDNNESILKESDDSIDISSMGISRWRLQKILHDSVVDAGIPIHFGKRLCYIRETKMTRTKSHRNIRLFREIDATYSNDGNDDGNDDDNKDRNIYNNYYTSNTNNYNHNKNKDNDIEDKAGLIEIVFDDNTKVFTNIVFGADGCNSKVRECMLSTNNMVDVINQSCNDSLLQKRQRKHKQQEKEQQEKSKKAKAEAEAEAKSPILQYAGTTCLMGMSDNFEGALATQGGICFPSSVTSNCHATFYPVSQNEICFQFYFPNDALPALSSLPPSPVPPSPPPSPTSPPRPTTTSTTTEIVTPPRKSQQQHREVQISLGMPRSPSSKKPPLSPSRKILPLPPPPPPPLPPPPRTTIIEKPSLSISVSPSKFCWGKLHKSICDNQCHRLRKKLHDDGWNNKFLQPLHKVKNAICIPLTQLSSGQLNQYVYYFNDDSNDTPNSSSLKKKNYRRHKKKDDKKNSSYPVVLLGDAAHPAIPYLGQGSQLGMEDAGTIALLLKKICCEKKNHSSNHYTHSVSSSPFHITKNKFIKAMIHYETIRIPRNNEIVQLSMEIGNLHQKRSKNEISQNSKDQYIQQQVFFNKTLPRILRGVQFNYRKPIEDLQLLEQEKYHSNSLVDYYLDDNSSL